MIPEGELLIVQEAKLADVSLYNYIYIYIYIARYGIVY